MCGELPTGVTVLEASAGTGKTFTIAALAARYVAAGVPLEHLLLVTFTRMATGELRDRVRHRLVTAEVGLARALAGAGPAGDDDVLAVLAAGPREEVERRRRRLAAALADFDAATIATTHGFCQHVLSGLGMAGDVERDITFVEDLSDLVAEVVDDLYVRRFHRGGARPLERDEALAIATAAVANPLAPVEPAAAAPDTDWAMRVRLACAVRREVERRKRRAGVLTYDDVLIRLAGTLADEARGPAARARLRERYRVALVDEFQDTDPVQWDVMRLAFAGGDATLVLIGDPKQAIYAFRGADVYAYLEASRTAGARRTLAVNWRSDQALVDACDALFGGTTLGHPGIRYHKVEAGPANREPRLLGAPCPAPLRVRVVHRDDGRVALTPQGYLQVAATRAHVAADLATDVVALLSAGAEVVARRPDGSEAAREPVAPGHVAVLVRTNRHAALVRDRLEAAGVPAVINGAGSVLATPAAGDWLALLEALERPASPGRARTAALTPFLGWTAASVALAGEEAWEEVHARLHRWAGVLRRRGVAAMLETVTRSEEVPGRLLALEDGERRLTDLRHVGQLLHEEAGAGQAGATALAAWLRLRMAEAGEDTGSEERSRRLESDAEAVQVLTIHRSKGLEFPVVYFPYLWDVTKARQEPPPVYHDPAHGNRRTLHVGGGGPGYPAARRQCLEEQRGEELRLAYVALTRARHQAVVWWAASWDSRDSALGRMLFARDGAGNVAAEGTEVPSEAAAVARFAELGAAAPGRVSVERATGGDGRRWAPPAGAGRAGLAARSLGRPLDTTWRRTSYSAITAAAHEARVASEPEAEGVVDEAAAAAAGGAAAAAGGVGSVGVAAGTAGPVPGAADPAEGDEGRLRAVPCPLAVTPAGPEIGTLVHAVLEGCDFTAPDLDAELAGHVEAERRARNLDVGPAEVLVAGLRAALESPLGPLAGGRRLRDVPRRHRLDELSFELPLVGGDRPAAELTVAAVADLLGRHVPAGDPLAGYARRLAAPALAADLRGYLTGSIDLVLRLPGAGGPDRFAVVDHKTNWLAPGGEALSAWHYRPAALAEAMQGAHYPLQALLYLVALHRYLRWRLPGYDPSRHLAGVLYLFLRGMTGPEAPVVDGRPCGVFSWAPPAGLVVGLSDLLDRGAPPPTAGGAGG